MQMHLNLGGLYEEFIKKEIESGLFSSASEVVRDALRRRMEHQQEQNRIDYIHELVNAGAEQIQCGEGIPYTSDFMDESVNRAKSNAKAGKIVHDAVKPECV